MKCFDVLCTYRYKNMDYNHSAKETPSFAKQMFQKKCGNCYRYGAALSYIARVLGYESRVGVGGVTAHAGSNLSAHGWCEILIGNTWKMCDCSMQRSYRNHNLYMVTRKEYPFRLRCDKVYKLNVLNGKVAWR